MKLLLVLCASAFVVVVVGALSTVDDDDGDLCENGDLKCYQTEYKAYIKCIEKQRKKRQICNFSDSVAPIVVAPIVQQQPPCTGQSCTYIDTCNGGGCAPPATNCVNSCTATCMGTNCQDRCDRSCRSEPIVMAPQQQIAPAAQGAPNVTTIIKLTNIVNNTNLVNVPTNINNTNVNNLDLGSNATAQQRHCCTVVQPRVCTKVNGTQGYRCVHRRHHTCGPQCESHTLHAQVRQQCNGPVENCPSRVAYIPQPSPNCHYQPQWPYVSCGKRTQDCSGCYDHYGYGFQNYKQSEKCYGCYDDGYAQGSLYRMGPYYRPSYYHAPPQPQYYSTPMSGYFGNEMVDPAFGQPSYSPYANMPYTQPSYYPSYQYYQQPAAAYPPQYPQYSYPQYQVPSYPANYPRYPYYPSYSPYYPPQRYPSRVLPETVPKNGTENSNDTSIFDENAIIPETYIDTYSPMFNYPNPYYSYPGGMPYYPYPFVPREMINKPSNETTVENNSEDDSTKTEGDDGDIEKKKKK